MTDTTTPAPADSAPTDSAPTVAPESQQAPGWRDARRLLHGPLRRLIAGQATGQAADGFAQIAFAQVVLFEIGEGASPAEIAFVLAVTLLPFSIMGPIAGIVIDRWPRRRVLAIGSVVRSVIAATGILAIATQSEPLAYVLVLLLLSTSRFVLAAKGAALPATVASEDLVPANATSSLAGMTAAFLGAVVGATFVAVVPGLGFAVASVLYLAAADRFRRLPDVGGGHLQVTVSGAVARGLIELIEGLQAAALDRAVRRPLLAVGTHRFLLGGAFVILVLVADTVYGFEAPGYGTALAVTGVAAFVGTVSAPILSRRHRPTALLPSTFLPPALAAAVAAWWTGLGSLLVGLAVGALAFQVLKVLSDALVGRAAAPEVRGRVFAAYDVIYNVAFVLAGLALIPLWDPARVPAILGWLALAFLVAWVVFARTGNVWPFTSAASRPTPQPRLSRRRRWAWRLLAFAAGAIPVLAFPEPDLWWVAWIGLVPLLLTTARAPTVREGAMRGWWGGAGFLVVMHHWLVPNVGPALPVFAFLVAVPLLAWGALVRHLLGDTLTTRRIVSAIVLVPSAWVVWEAIRAWEYLGGPWGLLGASQWSRVEWLSPAALGGVWLVSWLAVATSTGVACAVRASTGRRRAAAAILAAAVFAIGPIHSAIRRAAPEATPLRVGVVQPGPDLDARARFTRGIELTESLAGENVDLVVWGESSVGFDLEESPDDLATIEDAAATVGAEILVNVDARRSDGGGIFKSSVLVGPDGVEGRYDKTRLVPFGEYVPLRPVLGWVTGVSEAADADRRRGDGPVVLERPGVRLGPLVCFESSFPDLSATLAGDGANLVVVQSATTTFQESWTPEQHASLAAVRAMETGRPVLHATLSGVSAAFDGRAGRLLWLPTDHRGAVAVDVPLTAEPTIFIRFGPWVPAASLGVLVLWAVARSLHAARRASGTDTPADEWHSGAGRHEMEPSGSPLDEHLERAETPGRGDSAT